MSLRTLALALVLAAPACGTPTDDKVGTALVDAPPGGVLLPQWQLEDIQPASPRNGQTYGLDAFTNRIIVVSLLQGF